MNFFKDIKVIKELGAIGIAAFSMYVLFRILTNDLPHVSRSIERLAEVQSQSTAELSKVVSANTAVIEKYVGKR